MPRIGRVVIPDYPHHITQRGNRRQNVFFNDEDRQLYINYLRDHCKEAGVTFWAYCLMDNHVHLIAVPKQENSLARGIGEAHRKYTRAINFREKWRGYLWQGRFSSYPLEEKHLFAAVRYVERNPVRAGLVQKAEDYPYSSAKAHVYKQKNSLITDSFLSEKINDWSAYLSEEDNQSQLNLFRRHIRTGRPLGSERFIEKLERVTGRDLRKKKPGPRRHN